MAAATFDTFDFFFGALRAPLLTLPSDYETDRQIKATPGCGTGGPSRGTYWSALLIVRSRGQSRKGQSRLSRAWAEERPGRMRHGSWGRAHGWASVPPTASQTIAASSVDAVCLPPKLSRSTAVSSVRARRCKARLYRTDNGVSHDIIKTLRNASVQAQF